MKIVASRLLRYLHWLFVRGWPLWAALALIAAHIFALRCSSFEAEKVHGVVSLVTQIFGALLVVGSISSNFATIRKTTLGSELKRQFCAYWDARPRKRSDGVFVSPGAGRIKVTGYSPIVYNILGATLDERVGALEAQAEQLARRLEETKRDLSASLELHQIKTKTQFETVSESIGKVNATVEEVTLGGLHVQMFGLFLLLYSAVTGYLA